MNRIDKLFQDRKQNVLSVYFCAGPPSVEGTADVVRALAGNGVQMVEIGIPFSDPVADGPVIRAAATRAIRNGMTLRRLFSLLKDIRKDVDIPLVLMGYLNPIMQYGFEDFCRSCRDCGIDGMIIPDLPFRDYLAEYRQTARRYGLHVIMLITPETSGDRIRQIDENTGGFIYMVSSASVTGGRKDFAGDRLEYFRRIAGMGLRNPRMIGFGISSQRTWQAAAENASGGIVGSLFVQLLEEASGDADKAVRRLKTLLYGPSAFPDGYML